MMLSVTRKIVCVACMGGEVPKHVVEGATDPLHAQLRDVSLCLEQASNVQGLPAPEVAVYTPVKRKLQRPPVEAPASRSVSARSGGIRGRRTGRVLGSSWRQWASLRSAWWTGDGW